MNAFSYRLFSQTELQAVNDILQENLEEWVNSWFSAKSEFKFNVQELEIPFELNSENWIVLGHAPELWMAWHLGGNTSHDLVCMMFNEVVGVSERPSPLMQTMVQQLIRNFCSKIMSISSRLSFTAHPINEKLNDLRIDNGSGVVSINFSVGLVNQRVLFGGELVELLIETKLGKTEHPKIPLVHRESMLNQYATNLEIVVGSAKATLLDLLDMEVGDVIRLDTTIHEPCVVRGAGNSRYVAKAHLGMLGKHKAVQFIE